MARQAVALGVAGDTALEALARGLAVPTEERLVGVVVAAPQGALGGEAGLLLVILFMTLYYRLPGALAEGSGEHESFSAELEGGLEYPHYTRPAEFRGWTVPDVLLSGDHAKIEAWRRGMVTHP